MHKMIVYLAQSTCVISFRLQVDEELRDFIRDTINGNEGHNTAVVLMSDHGTGFAPVMLTQLGLLENKLPLLNMVLPKRVWSSSNTHKALKENRFRLLTAYDMHATLMNLLDYPAPAARASYHRGTSLLTPLSDCRTCEEAHIKRADMCTCLPWRVVEPWSATSDGGAAVKAFIAHINGQFSGDNLFAVWTDEKLSLLLSLSLPRFVFGSSYSLCCCFACFACFTQCTLCIDVASSL